MMPSVFSALPVVFCAATLVITSPEPALVLVRLVLNERPDTPAAKPVVSCVEEFGLRMTISAGSVHGGTCLSAAAPNLKMKYASSAVMAVCVEESGTMKPNDCA